MQYFCKNKQGDHTLAELFAKVPYHYSLPSDEEELVNYMTYKEIATDHERVRHITASQHAELIAILEKRLPRGSRILGDYVAHTMSPPRRGKSLCCALSQSLRRHVIQYL